MFWLTVLCTFGPAPAQTDPLALCFEAAAPELPLPPGVEEATVMSYHPYAADEEDVRPPDLERDGVNYWWYYGERIRLTSELTYEVEPLDRDGQLTPENDGYRKWFRMTGRPARVEALCQSDPEDRPERCALAVQYDERGRILGITADNKVQTAYRYTTPKDWLPSYLGATTLVGYIAAVRNFVGNSTVYALRANPDRGFRSPIDPGGDLRLDTVQMVTVDRITGGYVYEVINRLYAFGDTVSTERYTRDVYGKMLSYETDDERFTFAYRDDGQPTQVRNETTGKVREFVYDEDGRPLVSHSAFGRTHMTYDAYGSPIEAITWEDTDVPADLTINTLTYSAGHWWGEHVWVGFVVVLGLLGGLFARGLRR